MESFLKDNIFYLLFSALLFLHIAYWSSSFLGLILLLVYFFYISKSGQIVLSKLFSLSSKATRIRVLGGFFALLMLGLFSSFAILFFKLSPFIVSLVFLAVGFFFSLLEFWIGPLDDVPAEMYNPKLKVLEQVPVPTFTVAIYLMLFVYGVLLLIKSKTGAPILSPWQTIDEFYIYVFALATLILGFLAFSKLKAKTVLFLLILHTFLLHSYLPLTHENFYGADGWRHLSTENQILQEIPVDSSDFAISNGTFIQRIGWGELSYSQFWGLSIIFSNILKTNLLNSMVWLIPVLWSLFFPILLFQIARILGRSKKESLFFVWLSFLPYAFQAGGSFSLPVNFGFLMFLFGLLLLYARIKEQKFGQTLILAILGLVSLFGYALFCILFWLAWFIAEIIIFFNKKKKSKIIKVSIYIVLGIITFLIIPILELVSKYSIWSSGNFLNSIKSILGTFSGWYFASGPRTHDIYAGNIIFNQAPNYAFVPNIFTIWPWWIILFSFLFFLSVVYGFFVSLKKEKEYHLNNILFFGIFFSYIFSRYFLSGENILSRRLDVVLAFFFLWFLLLFLGHWKWGEKLFKLKVVKKYTKPAKKFSSFFEPTFLSLLIIIFTVAITTSYSLGPDTRVVSKDELNAVNYIWIMEKDNIRPCVLAGTYPLLALEAISAKHIVGGGFPIHAYFSQPERVNLLNKLLDNPSEEILESILNFSKSDSCWILTRRIKDPLFRKNFKNVQMFGPLMAGEYVGKN